MAARKKFEKLTRVEQRQRIVKDAIAQINSGLLKPTQGTYVRFGSSVKEGENMQTALQQGNKCTCCAKGALFASCVLNVNKVNINGDDLDSEGFLKAKLEKWFSPLQLDMIETAFERRVIVDDSNKLQINGFDYGITPLGEACLAFGKKYPKVSDRMLAILHNILEYGKFNPKAALELEAV